MSPALRFARDFLVSLKLTVVLLALGLILVFAATLDQVNLGIWGIQEKWFRSFVVFQQSGTSSFPVFPGGYSIGGLLLANLIAAHVYRFKRSWKKVGIELTHLGVILLLIGELLSGLWQEDFAMRITEGETKSYSESHHDNELAIIDTTNPEFDEVVAIPEALLATREPIQHPKLPFRVVVKEYFPNSGLSMRDAASTKPPQATAGVGASVMATGLPMTYKQDERNLPSASVELVGPAGSLGTWLVSPRISSPFSPPFLAAPQTFTHEGRTYRIALRFARHYKPFSLTLLKFSHDRYAGTEIPKNFSSKLRLTSPEGHDDREVLIYMNNPLRYAGLTFYQSGYDGEQTTVLQVVRNPSWQMPYVACALMTLGLLWQFSIHLVGFFEKRAAKQEAAS
ncbi:MAG: cytochrome c biogenesis protein ResB [Opitutaceae bacterium]|nr:cytochrome c biogenesis protein ResB [Opitutaceae bacterium]